MRKILLWGTLLLAGAALSACSAHFTPVAHESDLQSIDFGSSRLKKGSACGYTVLFFGPFGNTSIVKAARNGRIRKVQLQEHSATSYILFGQVCTNVYGE